jgi:hypothetical protein
MSGMAHDPRTFDLESMLKAIYFPDSELLAAEIGSHPS